MSTQATEPRGYGFAIGLLTGTCVGAFVAMWLAPRASAEIRDSMTDSARRLRRLASDQYQQVSTRVSEAVGEIARTGQDVRDDVVGAVARSANTVERFATAAKSDRGSNTRTAPGV